MVFLDGIVGPDTQPDNCTNSGTNNNGLTTPRHRRTMQSNYPGSGKRTERTLSNCLEGGFSYIAAATKVQVYGELALVEIDG